MLPGGEVLVRLRREEVTDDVLDGREHGAAASHIQMIIRPCNLTAG
jgi:hypothetical protein